ncbi:MAG: S8 family serine peptidase, partial [Planctomycetota bacterium]
MRRGLIVIFCTVLLVQALPASGAEKETGKIDGPVKTVLERIPAGRPIPVVLLGKTQLFTPPNGFDEFCKKNAGRKRSEVRREVVARLKEIAKGEQAKILEALGNPAGAKALWIVNAIYVNLAAEKIQKAATIEEVKYIYLGQMARRNPGAPGPAKTVAAVLKPKKREPFDPTGKKIPWNLEAIGAAKTWKELKITGAGVVVAMLDAGVNYKHEDLTANIWINEKEIPNNQKDDDGNGWVDDYYGYNFVGEIPEVMPAPGGRIQHGTLTSGILAGDGTGGTVTGVAPRAKIMA